MSYSVVQLVRCLKGRPLASGKREATVMAAAPMHRDQHLTMGFMNPSTKRMAQAWHPRELTHSRIREQGTVSNVESRMMAPKDIHMLSLEPMDM